MSILPDALVDKTVENQIPADIVYLHNLFQHLSHVAQCLVKQRSLILGRAISGLRAVQQESLLNGERLLWEEGRKGGVERDDCVCPHVCLYISSSAASAHNALQHPSESLYHI